MHDPLKVDLISNWKAVFADLFEAVAFIEANGAFVFAEHTDINIGGFSGCELLLGPSHELLPESLSEEFLTNVELPELHRRGVRIFSWDVDRADFGEADEFFFLSEDLELKVGIVEFFRN